MRNILIYISPSQSFDNPRHDLINDACVSVKVQIDNSLELGWAKEDIWLLTNFAFHYGGIEATVLDDVAFFERKPQASKINALIRLFGNRTIIKDEIYWFHDLDAFQICSISDLEIDMGTADIALSDYGVNSRWSTGVIYFKESAKDIFYKIRDVVYEKNIDEERALVWLTKNNTDINQRVKKINKTYNFVPRHLSKMYALSEKPLKVLHFHPLGEVSPQEKYRSFDVLRGENSLNIPFIPDRLLKIFASHQVT
jgi:hypothetical protein